FDLRGGEALGIDQSLLALVVGGGEMQIGFGDLDVKTKNRVELDLERGDSGALALALFDLGDVLPRVAAEIAKLIEVGVDAGRDHPAIGKTQGRLGDEGGVYLPAQIGEIVNLAVKAGESAVAVIPTYLGKIL